MNTIPSLIQRVQKTEHGFLDIQKASEEILAGHSAAETLRLAKELFSSDVHQARILAVFLFGKLAARSKESFTLLRKRVSLDKDWRVQETLAKAFDQYCKDGGYEKSLPVISRLACGCKSQSPPRGNGRSAYLDVAGLLSRAS